MPEPDKILHYIDQDTFNRAFRARLELAKLTGEKLLKEHQHNVAHTLLSCGISLIPSDHLLDHQFVVSRGVYDAAMKIAKAGG